MKLRDMFSITDLADALEDGYVRRQSHPTEPLTILNYTEKTAWESNWDDVTLACRGLIYNTTTMDVVARPFDKFFNYEQLGPKFVFPSGRVFVTDKQDGSLGILYPVPSGGWAVATRGSFASDQALHATRLLNDGLLYPLTLDRDITFLFEIIYPENRIVLNYGDMDELVLLGGVNIESGMVYSVGESALLLNWHGPKTRTFDVHSFSEALALPPRENAEGIVVRFAENDLMVKLKQADYVALHRIVTGMNERAVWERMKSGDSLSDIQRDLPEEFWDWVLKAHAKILSEVATNLVETYREYYRVLSRVPGGHVGRPERKDFALAVKDSPYKGWLFMLLDGKDIYKAVLSTCKPEAGKSMTAASD